MTTARTSSPADGSGPARAGHPRGLRVLFFTELWERFGFYTMMAIFVLYMDESLGWNDARKSDFYGWFLGAVYFVPILGGWLGDGVLGRKGTILLGALLMTGGYAALAASSRDQIAAFYAGLVLVAFGTGLFKANISVLVGQLYPDGSPLRDAGFNIFYMGVNLGAAAAPLFATWVHDRYASYNLSFAAASLGMLVSIAMLQWGRRHLVAAEPVAAAGAGRPMPSERARGDGRWTAEDSQRVVTLVVLFLIAIFFWVGFYQNGFALTLFAQRSTAPHRLLKPETYQFFGPFFILVLTPPLVWLFGRMRARGREPGSSTKITLGLAVAAASLLVMVAAAALGGDRDEAVMSPGWLIASYFLVSVGEILFSPMGLSFVSKVAPLRARGLMMGCWFSATAAGSYSSGLLGRLYGELPHHVYFLVIAGLLLAGASLALAARRWLGRFGG